MPECQGIPSNLGIKEEFNRNIVSNCDKVNNNNLAPLHQVSRPRDKTMANKLMHKPNDTQNFPFYRLHLDNQLNKPFN